LNPLPGTRPILSNPQSTRVQSTRVQSTQVSSATLEPHSWSRNKPPATRRFTSPPSKHKTFRIITFIGCHQASVRHSSYPANRTPGLHTPTPLSPSLHGLHGLPSLHGLHGLHGVHSLQADEPPLQVAFGSLPKRRRTTHHDMTTSVANRFRHDHTGIDPSIPKP
jgi:hypothetical protein